MLRKEKSQRNGGNYLKSGILTAMSMPRKNWQLKKSLWSIALHMRRFQKLKLVGRGKITLFKTIRCVVIFNSLTGKIFFTSFVQTTFILSIYPFKKLPWSMFSFCLQYSKPLNKSVL